jgi:hypothetical protein
MKAKFRNQKTARPQAEYKEDNRPRLTPRDYQTALDSQSACNLTGLVNSLLRVLPAIWAECDNTDAVNNHPITRLYAEQIAHLSSDIEYQSAFSICRINARKSA